MTIYSTSMSPQSRGDLDDWLTYGASHSPLTQEQIDTPPRDRRERDGEAFDVPPLGFGYGLVWGEGERQPRDWPETLGSIAGAAIVVGIAVFVAWFAARQMGGAGWR